MTDSDDFRRAVARLFNVPTEFLEGDDVELHDKFRQCTTEGARCPIGNQRNWYDGELRMLICIECPR